VAGAGIGTAGPIDLAAGTVSPLNVAAWRGYPLRDLVSDLVSGPGRGIPVTLRIDGEAIALAEHWVGAARGADSLLGMVVSTGVGGGIMTGGRTIPGPTGNAGHVGHIGVPGPDAVIRCACGGIGCVEAIASGPRSVQWARDRGWPGTTGEELGASAAAGDSTARAAIRRSANAVGFGIASAAALLDLEMVAIGGGFARVSEDYLDLVRQPLSGPEIFTHGMRVVASGLGGDGPLIGAAAFVHRADSLG
jgi:glucokinase